jgi:hypothetical protein
MLYNKKKDVLRRRTFRFLNNFVRLKEIPLNNKNLEEQTLYICVF